MFVCEGAGSVDRVQVHRRIFAAAIDFDVELHPVALSQAGHAGPLDRADMDKGIGLAIFAFDEAEALHTNEIQR